MCLTSYAKVCKIHGLLLLLFSLLFLLLPGVVTEATAATRLPELLGHTQGRRQVQGRGTNFSPTA